MKAFFLKTIRLGFSTWDETDLADALGLWGNSEVTRYIVAGGKMTDEQVLLRLKKEIDTYQAFKVQYFPVYLLESTKLVGCCGLRPYERMQNTLEFGIHLKQEFWGKGYAGEAGQAMIHYAFGTIGVDSLFAGHHPNNKMSGKFLKGLGFQYTYDEFYEPTGLHHPSYLLTEHTVLPG